MANANKPEKTDNMEDKSESDLTTNEDDVKSKPLSTSGDGSSISLYICTWNIKHGSHKLESVVGFSEAQHLFIKALSSEKRIALYCIQETTAKKMDGLFANFSVSEEKTDAAISRAIKEIQLSDGTIAVVTDSPPPVLLVPEKTGHDLRSEQKVDPCRSKRFHCRKITIQTQDSEKILHEFILVSNHQKYKGNSLEKIEEFFERMCIIANIHKMTVIVGGDFNKSLDEWKEQITKKFDKKVVIADLYELGPRRQDRSEGNRKGLGLIDTFAVVYPDIPNYTICTMGKPFAVAFESRTSVTGSIRRDEEANFQGLEFSSGGPNKDKKPSDNIYIDESELEKISDKNKKDKENAPSAKDLFDMMDHDPVVVEITLHQAPAEDK